VCAQNMGSMQWFATLLVLLLLRPADILFAYGIALTTQHCATS